MGEHPAVLAAVDRAAAAAREEAAAVVAYYRTLVAGRIPRELRDNLLMCRFGWSTIPEDDEDD